MKKPTLQQNMDEIPPPPSDKVVPMLPVDIPMPLDTPEVSIIEGFTDEPITPPGIEDTLSLSNGRFVRETLE